MAGNYRGLRISESLVERAGERRSPGEHSTWAAEDQIEAAKDKEELLSLAMKMERFARFGRHLLFDYRQARALQQEPGLATFSPVVVLGVHSRYRYDRRVGSGG
jgi:hypothetical protein